MVSPANAVEQHEIWLYAPPGTRMPVEACGLFGSEREACRVGARVRDWLRLGVWAAEFDALPDDAVQELYLLRFTLARGMGVDLSRVLVTARPYPAAGGDNAPLVVTFGRWRTDAGGALAGPVGTDDDDDGDADDDTPLAPPEVVYLPTDDLPLDPTG